MKFTRLYLLLALTGLFVMSLSAQNFNDKIISKEWKNEMQVFQAVCQSAAELETDVKLRAKTILADSAITYTASGIKESKNVYFYDSKGNLIVNEVYIWKTGKWVASYKNTYGYDAQGNMVLDEKYKWESSKWVGEYKNTYAYGDDGNKRTTSYTWESGGWVNPRNNYRLKGNKAYIETAEYQVDEIAVYFYWIYAPSFGRGRGSQDIIPLYNYEYDSNGNLVSFNRTLSYEWGTTIDRVTVDYDSKNNPILIQGYEWLAEFGDMPTFKAEYTYDENGGYILEDMNWEGGQWVYSQKYIVRYDEKGRQTLFERYKGNEANNGWFLDYKSLYTYDAYGNRQEQTWDLLNNDWLIESNAVTKTDDDGNVATSHSYSYNNGKWELQGYTINYPSIMSEMESVDDDGSLDIYVPDDATVEGGFLAIDFPPGMYLDGDKTTIFIETASRPIIISSMGQSWSCVRSLELRNNKAGKSRKLLNLVYHVDDTVKQGTYTAYLRDVNFELSDGTHILEDGVPITIEVTGSGVSIAPIEIPVVQAYLHNNVLTIQSDHKETIDIFSITGQRIYSAEKSLEGFYTIDASAFPQGMLIIKGSSGWTKKVMNQ